MEVYKGIRYAGAECFGMPQIEPALRSLEGIETTIMTQGTDPDTFLFCCISMNLKYGSACPFDIYLQKL